MGSRAGEGGASRVCVSAASAMAFREERPVTDAGLAVGAASLTVVAALAHLWAAPVYFVDLWGYETSRSGSTRRFIC